jgi:hypothetical protein
MEDNNLKLKEKEQGQAHILNKPLFKANFLRFMKKSTRKRKNQLIKFKI